MFLKSSNQLSLLLTISLTVLVHLQGSAQCTTNCTPLQETFGSTSSCGIPQNSTNPYIVNHTVLPYNGGSNDYPNDGQYAIRCNGDQVNWGWFGAGGTTISDHTADAAGQTGNFAIVNSGSGPVEFYHRTVSNLCANTTYSLTYSAGNFVRDDFYSNMPSLTAYTFPAGTPVQPNNTFSGAGGTLLGSTGNIVSPTSAGGFVWNTYSYNFTTGAGQTSIDVVLVSLFGNNAGFDFVVDDITVSWVSGGGVSCTLPVTLLSFNALQPDEQKVALEWQTIDEVNCSHYVLERSEDGIHFYPIALFNALGKGTQHQFYQYEDEELPAAYQEIYYRLHVIDLDGSSAYSKVISIKVDDHSFGLYPNPVSRGENLVVKPMITKEESELAISIINPVGVIISTVNCTIPSPVNINTENLSSGIYFLQLKSTHQNKLVKFMVK
jgi:hypothetical protein